MARKRTKRQKKQAEKRRTENISVSLDESGNVVVTSEKLNKKNKSTKISETQVSLVYKDLLKTAVVSLIVFILLLFIFVYMR